MTLIRQPSRRLQVKEEEMRKEVRKCVCVEGGDKDLMWSMKISTAERAVTKV